MLVNAAAYGASSLLESCHSFLPYGHLFGYLSLPRQQSFCVRSGNASILYNTDENGGRIFGPLGADSVVVFGESQALGMDSNELPRVYQQMNANSAVVYATPNSGPLETLARVKRAAFRKADRFVVVFNFGFDVFRLLPRWDARKLNSLSIFEAEEMVESPRLFALKSLWRALRGEAVALAGDNSVEMRVYFLNHRNSIEKGLEVYLDRILPELVQALNAEGAVDLLVYPPYWDPKLNDVQVATVFRRFVSALQRKSGIELRVVDFRGRFDPATMLRGDKRHFASTIPLEPP